MDEVRYTYFEKNCDFENKNYLDDILLILKWQAKLNIYQLTSTFLKRKKNTKFPTGA